MDRVTVVPCNGIGKAIATVVREAAISARQRCPELVSVADTSELCASAGGSASLASSGSAGGSASLAGSGSAGASASFAGSSRVIVVDGCSFRCGRIAVLGAGGSIDREIFAPLIAGRHRISMEGAQRSRLGGKAQQLIDLLADEILHAASELTAVEGTQGATCLEQPVWKGDGMSPESPHKAVAVMTCSSLAAPAGSLARLAVYRVAEQLRPDTTVLVCLPATNADVQEDIDFISHYPILAVEASDRRLATQVLAKKGRVPASTIMVESLVRVPADGWPSSGLFDHLSPGQAAAVEVVARAISDEVGRLLSDLPDVSEVS